MKIDSHVHIGVDPLFYLNGWSPFCLDLPRLRTEAAGSGIDRWVVFPFVSYMALDAEAMRRGEVTLGRGSDQVPYRFENERLLTDISRLEGDSRRAFLPFLIADPGRRAEEQVEVWRGLTASQRVFGIKIQPTIIQSPIVSLLREGRAMLDFAEENDLPFLIHSSIHPDDRWSQCSDILRVAESRPDVRFVLAHSCRFHRPSLDRVAELANTWFDCSGHVIHCLSATTESAIIAAPGERFPADYSSPASVLQALADAYPDKLIWGSDAPFYSYEDNKLQLRSSYAIEAALLNSLDAKSRERVSYRNTVAWLGTEPA